MRYLVVEDERIAADRLIKAIQEIRPAYELVGRADSVKLARGMIREMTPDLLFLDIHLSDGLSLEIFDQEPVEIPIIFTTAYDQYAIQAFKLNSIDYLLKPIDPELLRQALEKYDRLYQHQVANYLDPVKLSRMMDQLNKQHKERFVIRIGEHLTYVQSADAGVFYSEDKITYLHTEGRRFIVDYTLDRLEQLLDPDLFFRISRKYIVNWKSIQDMIHYSNSRLKVSIRGLDRNDIIVARERVQAFKQWLDR